MSDPDRGPLFCVLAGVAVLAVLLRGNLQAEPTSARASAAAASASARRIALRGLPPLERGPTRHRIRDLTVLVEPPTGATESRPLTVALLPGLTSAGSACEGLTDRLRRWPVVVCLDVPGEATPTESVRAALREALALVRKNLGDHLAPGSALLLGVGSGAELALALALEEPSFFQRLALFGVEPARWTTGVASAFGARGGRRVLLAHGASEDFGSEAALARTTPHGVLMKTLSSHDPWTSSAFLEVGPLDAALGWLTEGWEPTP